MEENEKNYLDWEGLLEYHEKIEERFSEIEKVVASALVDLDKRINDLQTMVQPVQEMPEAVNLDLPSGKLWSDRNIGASSAESTGLYFAWGETEGYRDANDRNAKLGISGGFSSDSYNPVSEITDNYDAAVQNIGNGWRMPNRDEMDELIYNTTVEPATINGVKGIKFSNLLDSSKYIFMPVVGVYELELLLNSDDLGAYWTSTYRNNSGAYRMQFFYNDEDWSTNYDYKYVGCPIRPIKDN